MGTLYSTLLNFKSNRVLNAFSKFHSNGEKSKSNSLYSYTDIRSSNSASNRKAPKKIIIADDAADLIIIYRKALEMNGHSVVMTATDGMSLIEFAKDGKSFDVDVALLDYRMGNVDGLEVGRELVSAHPEIRVVIASGDHSIERDAKRAGFAFLRKPFTISELLNEL